MTKNELLDLLDRFAARAELLEERQQSLVRLFQSVQNFRTIAETAAKILAALAENHQGCGGQFDPPAIQSEFGP